MNKSKEAQLMEDLKRREYLKQQELLRNMSRPKNNLSADAMIENLLSKKEIFQKKPPQNQASSNQGNIPVPGAYVSIWEWCRFTSNAGETEICDTSKLSSLLMTSRLPTDTLGYIWSLANLTIPGSLTQQELYTTLALVALAQSGYSFRSAAVITQMGRYPIPMLDMSLVERSTPVAPPPPPPDLLPQPLTEEEDEFDDFKSADLSGLNVDNLKVLEVGSSNQASLIRFDSPKRPLGALSLLESPSKGSPTQLSVLDLPLTETSHQPPFNRVPTPPPDADSPDKICLDPINSISGGILPSPHQVEDLFPKCSIQRSTDLLDWMGTPPDQQEEYLTCDLATNTIQITSSSATPNIIPNPLMDENSFSDFTSNSSPEPSKDKSSQDSISVDSLRFDDLKLTDLPSLTQHCDKCPESDRKLASMDFEDFPLDTSCKNPPIISDTQTKKPENMESINHSIVDINSKGINSTLHVDNSVGLLDFEDKYSALRSLEQKDNPSSDDFGDFIAAEPLSHLEVSPPLILPQPNIKEQCIEACLRLLNQAITSFKSVSNEKVLMEVLDDHRCKKYLEELGEVYRVCERLVRSSGNEEARAQLDTCWSTLGNVTRQALPPIKIEEKGNEGVKCGLCQEESKLEEQVRYAMNQFHPSCASLYLHCIPGSTLPLQPF